VDHAHAHLLDGHRARTEVGLQHDLLAHGEALAAEVLLGHALAQPVAALAVGLGGGDVGAEALAGLAAFHRLLQPRDDVAVAHEDGQRLAAVLRAFHRLAALLGHGVVEADDAVFLDLHGHGIPVARPGPLVGSAPVGEDAGRWTRP